MDIFGIGPLEFFLILIIALIILGPNDMAKAGRSLGQFLRRLVMSEEWRIITRSASEFKHLPNRLIREAGLEEIKNELPDLRRDADLDGLNKDLQEWQKDVSSWTKQPNSDETNLDEPERTIAPPQKIGNNKPALPQPAQSQSQKFSWDDPDIIPVEDNKS